MSTVGFQSLFSLPYFESVLNYLGHFRRQMAVFCDISGDVPSNENSSKTAQNSARIQKIRMNCQRVIFEKIPLMKFQFGKRTIPMPQFIVLPCFVWRKFLSTIWAVMRTGPIILFFRKNIITDLDVR